MKVVWYLDRAINVLEKFVRFQVRRNLEPPQNIVRRIEMNRDKVADIIVEEGDRSIQIPWNLT